MIARAIYAPDSQQVLATWFGVGLTTGLSIDETRGWQDGIRAVTAHLVRAAARKWLDKKPSVTGYLMTESTRSNQEKRS
ncbi:putative Zn-dependent peptidase [Bradyrhizobium sp. i1.4.4]